MTRGATTVERMTTLVDRRMASDSFNSQQQILQVRVGRCGQSAHDVAGAGRRVGLDDAGQGGQELADLGQLPLRDLEGGQRLHRETGRLQIELWAVADDHAGAVPALHPRADGGPCHPRQAGQFEHADAGILVEQAQQPDVESVKVH